MARPNVIEYKIKLIKDIFGRTHKKYIGFLSIFNSLYKLINYYLSKSRRMFYMRLDLRFPKNFIFKMSIGQYVSKFNRKFMKKLRKKKLFPKYLRAREQNISDNPHYHYALLLNGYKIIDYYKISKLADSVWDSILGGAYPRRTDSRRRLSGVVDRCSSEYDNQYMQALECFLYLTKIDNKSQTGSNIRDYDMSHIPNDGVNYNIKPPYIPPKTGDLDLTSRFFR